MRKADPRSRARPLSQTPAQLRRALIDESQVDEAADYCGLWSRVLFAWEANHSLVEQRVDSYGNAVVQLAELKNYVARPGRSVKEGLRTARHQAEALLDRCFTSDRRAPSVSGVREYAARGGPELTAEQLRARGDDVLALAIERQERIRSATAGIPSQAGTKVLTLLREWRAIIETRTLLMEVLRGERDEFVDSDAVAFASLCDALKRLDTAVAVHASHDPGAKALRRVAHQWDRLLLHDQLVVARAAIEQLDKVGAYSGRGKPPKSFVGAPVVRDLARMVGGSPRKVVEALVTLAVGEELHRKDQNGKRKGTAKTAAEVALSQIASSKWAKIPKRATSDFDDGSRFCCSVVILERLLKTALEHDRLDAIPPGLFGIATRLLRVPKSRPASRRESTAAKSRRISSRRAEWSCLDDWLEYQRKRLPKWGTTSTKAIRATVLEFLADRTKTSYEELEETLGRADREGFIAREKQWLSSELKRLKDQDVDALLGLSDPKPGYEKELLLWRL